VWQICGRRLGYLIESTEGVEDMWKKAWLPDREHKRCERYVEEGMATRQRVQKVWQKCGRRHGYLIKRTKGVVDM
jgi:hypothetical protein